MLSYQPTLHLHVGQVAQEAADFLLELLQGGHRHHLGPHHGPRAHPLPRPCPFSLQLYAPIPSKLRVLLVSRMAKPEEVLIVEDENGEIVRETRKDSDAITLYKTMRETLVYLTHLNYDDTENIMLEKLQYQAS